MKRLGLLAISLAVLASCLLFLIGRRPDGQTNVSSTTPANPPVRSETVLATVDLPPAAASRETPPSKEADSRNPERELPAQHSNRAEIKGRFLLPDGAPASGVSIEVQGHAGNQERLLKFGMPDSWENPTASSGPDGRFSVPLDPPRAFQFYLEGRLDGYCKERWRWFEIQPGETKDVGDIVLRRGGAVAGKVLDAAGRPIRQEWMVYAQGATAADDTDKEAAREHVPLDVSTGEFRIEGLAPGQVSLKAHSPVANWIEGPSVEIRAGEVAQANIVYTGPDVSSRITVITFTEPFYIFNDNVEEIVLRGAGIEPRKASKIEHSSQSFSFQALPPGRYSVEIHDPRFVPWNKDGVEPGTSVAAHLKGSSSVRLSVVDPGGNPLPRYTLQVRFDKSNTRPNVFSLLETGQDPPRDGLFDGLIPTDQTLVVSAEGFADSYIGIPDLRPNEIRAVTARMSSGAGLSGIVLQGRSRKPVPHVEVYLLSPIPSQNGNRWLPSRDDPSIRSVKADENGRFAFSMLPSGVFDLRAEWASRHAAEIDNIELSGSEVQAGIELLLPDVASLHGRVIGPEGANFNGLALVVRPAPAGSDAVQHAVLEYGGWANREASRIPLEADGSYRASLVEAGDLQVSIQLPNVRIPTGFQGWSWTDGPTIPLGEVTLPADADVERDFDLRSSSPGTVRLSATVNGAPASGVVAEIKTLEEIGLSVSRWTVSAASLDTAGRARLGPLEPKDYQLLLRSVDTSWFFFAPSPLRIVSGAETELSIDVPLVAGDLQVLQAESGEPLVSPQLLIRLDGNPRSPAIAIVTDSKGMAQLRVPPARYVISLGYDFMDLANGQELEKIAFDWTDRGPVPPSVKLKRGEEPR